MSFYGPFFGSCSTSVGCEYDAYYYDVYIGMEEEARHCDKEAPESFALPEWFGVV